MYLEQFLTKNYYFWYRRTRRIKFSLKLFLGWFRPRKVLSNGFWINGWKKIIWKRTRTTRPPKKFQKKFWSNIRNCHANIQSGTKSSWVQNISDLSTDDLVGDGASSVEINGISRRRQSKKSLTESNKKSRNIPLKMCGIRMKPGKFLFTEQI